MPEFSLPFDSASDAPDEQCPVLPGKVYIYALLDPRDGRIRYVGKSNKPARRFYRHLTDQLATRCARWLCQLLALNLRPVLRILEVVPRDEWQTHERRWIAYLRSQGCQLTNLTEGGEGWKPNEETRAKLRAARIGKRPKSFDSLWTPECRAKRSAGVRRQWARMSDDERAARLAHCQSPEARKKRADSHRDKKRPPEVGIKVSAGKRTLSVEQVAEIRRLLAEGCMTGTAIAKQFGTSPTMVCRIGKRTAYATPLDLPPQESSNATDHLD